MKRLLAVVVLSILALAAASSPAKAGDLVIQTALTSHTVVGMAISSSPAVSILGGTQRGWRQIGIQNLDTSAALYCGDTINVSSVTSNAAGVVIAPATSAVAVAQPTWFYILANQDYFCRTGSTSASTRAVIIKIQ